MQLFVHLPSRRFTPAVGDLTTVVLASLKRGDTVTIPVRFWDGVAAVDLGSGATGRCALKLRGAFTGQFLAMADWVKTGSGASSVYTFILATHTQDALDAFSAMGEPGMLDSMLEISWEVAGGVASTATLAIDFLNDVIRGNEGDPTLANDTQSSQAEAEAGVNNSKWMSPLRTSQAIAVMASPLGHGHAMLEIDGLTSALASAGAVQSVAGRTGDVLLGASDITDLASRVVTKIESLTGALSVSGSVGEVAMSLAIGTGSNEVCAGNDSRLSDARPPTAHGHLVSHLDDMRGHWMQIVASLTANPPLGLTAVPTYNNNVPFPTAGWLQVGGVTSNDLVVGDDSRLSDARNPTSHTHPHTAITGLGTAATSAAASFATSAQGTKADTAVQGVTGATGMTVLASANAGAAQAAIGLLSALGGGQVGFEASSLNEGGAMGRNAETDTGGAMGWNATSTNGFAGGDHALADGQDRVQLGYGTNSVNSTIQFLSAGSVNTTRWGYLAGATTTGGALMQTTSGSAACATIGAVKNSGDTMTGNLTLAQTTGTALTVLGDATIADLTVTGDFVHSGEGGIVTESLEVLGNAEVDGNATLNGTANTAPNQVFGANNLLTGGLGDARYGRFHHAILKTDATVTNSTTAIDAVTVVLPVGWYFMDVFYRIDLTGGDCKNRFWFKSGSVAFGSIIHISHAASFSMITRGAAFEVTAATTTRNYRGFMQVTSEAEMAIQFAQETASANTLTMYAGAGMFFQKVE
jgi:hypothetical protein